MTAKKHLTGKERLQIEIGLKAGKRMSEIAEELGKSASTIAREIRKHALESEKGAAGRIKNRCVHRYECQKANLCPQFPCAYPKHQLKCRLCGKCNSVCMDFEEEVCPRLEKAPYVCNGCKDEHKCVLHKRFYLHYHAQMEYENVLTESRSGANITELELKAVEAFLSPLLKNGQSPHNVMLNFPDRFSFCEKTLYRYSKTGSYLTIEKREGGTVPVVIWEVTEQDEKALDRYEGCPNFYYKRELKVKYKGFRTGKRRTVTAFVYIMHEERPIGVPSNFYMRTCLEGYDTFYFDPGILLAAYDKSLEVCGYERD